MAVSPLKLIQERARQAATQDDKYFQKLLYFFELRLPSGSVPLAFTGPEPAFLFPLVLGPNSYSMEEPFTLEATPTQGGGLYTEENGIVQRTIRLQGTTGFKPRTLNRGDASNATLPLLALSPEKRSYSRALRADVLDAISGQRHFQYLQDAVFRTYADLKRDPATSQDTVMLFHNPKDDEHWIVKPQRFVLDRDSSRPTLYNYTIELLAVDKADSLDADFSEDKPLLDAIKDTIRMVKSGLDLAAGAFNDLTALTAELTGLVKDFGKLVDGVGSILDAATNFVEGVNALIESPYAILESMNGVIDSANELTATLEEVGGRTPPRTVTHKLREVQDGLNRMGTHPEAFETPFQRTVRETKQRQELLTSATTDTLDEAEASDPPSTLSAVENQGTGLTSGDVQSAAAELGIGRDIRNFTGAREVTLFQGDTLISLAARFLGDARLWQHIAILNGLRPPYINDEMADQPLTSDDSPFSATLGLGDTILIPNFSKPPSEQPVLPVLGVRLEAPAEVQFLGTDMALEAVGGRPGAELFDIPIDVEGGSQDAKTVAGIPNMQQSIIQRLKTEKGHDQLYKRLGLPRVVGLNNRVLDLENARFRVKEALEADGRVASVRRIVFESNLDQLIMDADVELRGFTEGTTVQIPL